MTRQLHPGGLSIAVCLALLLWTLPCVAEKFALKNADQLTALLRKTNSYQVIDARTDAAKSDAPIASATAYHEDLQLDQKQGWISIVGASLVVVGDSDTQALAVAQSLAVASGWKIYAVKGGYSAWQKIAARAPASESSMPSSFVIPSDTCQQGTPLQEIKR